VHIEFGLRSDVGKIRTSNEDSYAASAKNHLFVVADGMGGHAAGEIASQIAVATVEEVVARRADEADPEETVRAAAREANLRIYETQRQNPELSGMGSTLTILYVRDGNYYIAQVGIRAPTCCAPAGSSNSRATTRSSGTSTRTESFARTNCQAIPRRTSLPARSDPTPRSRSTWNAATSRKATCSCSARTG